MLEKKRGCFLTYSLVPKRIRFCVNTDSSSHFYQLYTWTLPLVLLIDLKTSPLSIFSPLCTLLKKEAKPNSRISIVLCPQPIFSTQKSKHKNDEKHNMSGGVGPTYNDISPPQEEQQHESKQNDDNSATASSKNKTHRTPKKGSSFLSFRQLNCLAVIVTLSATGLVCPEDMAFVLFSIIYMYFLSIVAFPKLTSKEPPVFDIQKGLLSLYVFVGAIIGLLLPIAYIFEGIFEGDREGIKAAIPHLFLLASQVFMEGVAFSDRFSTPIRVFIPVCYNSMRISTIVEWLRNEFSKESEEFGGSPRRLYIGRGLAIANMAFWFFNLFGFLLPVYLPKAFKRYYSDSKVKD